MIKLFVHLYIDLKVYIYFDYICTSLTFTYKYLYIGSYAVFFVPVQPS